jgi:hypothetical protein
MALKSKRQKIVDAIDARFKTISERAGYETEVGETVNWWVMPPIEQVELPAVCLKDTDVPAWAGVGEHLHELKVSAEIYLAPVHTEAATVMRQVIADMTTVIGKDVTWGGLAEDTNLPAEEELSIAQAGDCFVAIGFSFVVQFLTEPWNAYE